MKSLRTKRSLCILVALVALLAAIAPASAFASADAVGESAADAAYAEYAAGLAADASVSYVENEDQLQYALNDGNVGTIVFVTDFAITRKDLVINPSRASDTLTLEGNGHFVRDAYAEKHDKYTAIRQEKGDTLKTINVQNFSIDGQNQAGFLNVIANGVTVYVSNTYYQGPQFIENEGGTVILENAYIIVQKPSQQGTEQNSAIEANVLEFRGGVTIAKVQSEEIVPNPLIMLRSSNAAIRTAAGATVYLYSESYKGAESSERAGAAFIYSTHSYEIEVGEGSYIGLYGKGVPNFFYGRDPSRLTVKKGGVMDVQGKATEKFGFSGVTVLHVGGAVTVEEGATLSIMCGESHGSEALTPSTIHSLLFADGDVTVNAGSLYLCAANNTVRLAAYPLLLMRGGSTSGLYLNNPAGFYVENGNTYNTSFARAIGFLWYDGKVQINNVNYIAAGDRVNLVDGRYDSVDFYEYKAADGGEFSVALTQGVGGAGKTKSVSFSSAGGGKAVVTKNGDDAGAEITAENFNLRELFGIVAY